MTVIESIFWGTWYLDIFFSVAVMVGVAFMLKEEGFYEEEPEISEINEVGSEKGDGHY